VVRLECMECGTGIDGEFDMGRLFRLSVEQRRFVETFLRCRGKIKDVEEELGVSYPTVVARLNEVVADLGFDPLPDAEEGQETEPEFPQEPGRDPSQVIEQLYEGSITAAEATARLRGEG
jgi:hypothetical protein